MNKKKLAVDSKRDEKPLETFKGMGRNVWKTANTLDDVS